MNSATKMFSKLDTRSFFKATRSKTVDFVRGFGWNLDGICPSGDLLLDVFAFVAAVGYKNATYLEILRSLLAK